jgi:mevalonate kinase
MPLQSKTNPALCFQFDAPGKWVLAGEHAVLVGQPAVLAPLSCVGVRLTYQPDDCPLRLSFAQGCVADLKHFLTYTMNLLGQNLACLRGSLSVSGDLPMGIGLGYSAALCTVVTRFCQHQGWLGSDGLTFAMQLESFFHGQSSGMDVCCVWGNQPILYAQGTGPIAFHSNWSPYFLISPLKVVSRTADCVAFVNDYRQRDPDNARQVDCQMGDAVRRMAAVMQGPVSREAHACLTQSFTDAADCFKSWGLSQNEAYRQRASELTRLGALACKPTGAGKGGCILSLWQGIIPQSVVRNGWIVSLADVPVFHPSD